MCECVITILKVKHLLCLTGIDEISEDVEHSDSEESDKSDSSDSEYGSNDEQKSKSGQDCKNSADDKNEKEPPKKKSKPSAASGKDKDSSTESAATASTPTKGEISQKSTSNPIAKDKPGMDSEEEPPEKQKGAQVSSDSREKPKNSSEEAGQPPSVDVDMDSDSERELVIDLGEEQAGKERKRNRKDSAAVTALKEPTASKTEGQIPYMNQCQ